MKKINNAEERYIRKRKLQAFGNRVCFYLCRIFPVDRKLISVCTFEGKGGFCCNPKYIIQELHKEYPEYKIVWFLNKSVWNKEFPKYIKKVPNTLWSRAYWLSRSKIWIDNYRKPFGTVKRKGQYYLNTWHGAIFIKPIGLWRGSAFSKMAYLVSENDSKMVDEMIVDSKWCINAAEKGFLYSGKYLNVGMPRYDILFGDKTEQRSKIHEYYGLSDNIHIALYAPTFREKSDQGVRSVHSEVWSLDFRKTIMALEKKFGGIWYFCIRVHPQLATQFSLKEEMQSNSRLIDGNEIEDMYELLAGMDLYISDYSSAAFEAAYSGIPVFIYADDIEQYSNDRGKLMWNITGDNMDKKSIVPNCEDILFPFEIAKNNFEMIKNIELFDLKEYSKKIEKFKNDIGLIFDGKSSCKAVEHINGWMR